MDCVKIGTKIGKVIQKDGKARSLKMQNVKYVPKLHYNLIAFPKLLNYGKELRGSKTMMKIMDGNSPPLTFDRKIKSENGFLFGIKILNEIVKQHAIGNANKVRFVNSTKVNINLADQMLGHSGAATLRTIASNLG